MAKGDKAGIDPAIAIKADAPGRKSPTNDSRSPADPAPTQPSSAIAHAIHHYALIAVMARLMQEPLPAHFGIAPSTAVHLRETAAAR